MTFESRRLAGGRAHVKEASGLIGRDQAQRRWLRLGLEAFPKRRSAAKVPCSMAKRKTTAARSPYLERLRAVRAEMDVRELDGLLVLDRMDQIWLTGFTGEDGAVLVTPRSVVLLTDGRFDESADREAPWARKVLRKTRGPEETAKQIQKAGLERVGYDPAQMTVATFTALKKAARPATLAVASGVIGPLREIKDRTEIRRIRAAIDCAQQAMVALKRWLKPGQTEREIAARLIYEMQKRGAQEASFPPIVAAGATGSLPHYEPGNRKLKKDQGLLIDWGARVDWYISDLTRVLCVGKMSRRLEKIYAIVKEAHDQAVAALAPGKTGAEIDAVARRIISKAGYGDKFMHSLGHGIGLDVHEQPRLSKLATGHPLEAGMVVTVEPGIYLPGFGGVRLESDVLVTRRGYEILSDLPM